VGGGVEFGESALTALSREFEEEASIHIKPGRFLFGCEYINGPLHAVELFFEVFYESGKVSLGKDPESEAEKQVLKEVRYMEFDELMALNPDERHGIFRFVRGAEDLKKLSGFYVI
jgi:8-oxo-dGTP diphosphatase